MLHKDASGMYKSSLFSDIDNLVHGFSSRSLGDGRTQVGKLAICAALVFEEKNILQSKQIHSAIVKVVSDSSEQIVPDADGLVAHVSTGVALGVRTADCTPILLVDPVAHITSAVHAGWKGSAGEIVKHAVDAMVEKGANVSDIRATIGPHIGMCCYNVDELRAKIFSDKYPNDPKVISRIGGVWHLDIGWVNYLQLREAGLSGEHIDAPITCTSCQIAEFYSYRKDTKESFGEMLGIIGWKTV